MKQFGRRAELNVDNQLFDSDKFDFDFEVDFDDNPEPNESRVTIYNLTSSTVNQFERSSALTLNAGYKDDTGLILFGYASNFRTRKSGVDKETVINVMDEQPFDIDRTINKSYKSYIKASQIIDDLLDILRIEASVDLPDDKSYPDGYDVEGEASEEIASLAQDCGAIFYINQGKAFVRSIKSDGPAEFNINPDTGLIRTPSYFEEENEDGEVVKGYNVEMLLQHRIKTASVVKIESSTADGRFYVRSGKHRGDDREFITKLEVIT